MSTASIQMPQGFSKALFTFTGVNNRATGKLIKKHSTFDQFKMVNTMVHLDACSNCDLGLCACDRNTFFIYETTKPTVQETGCGINSYYKFQNHSVLFLNPSYFLDVMTADSNSLRTEGFEVPPWQGMPWMRLPEGQVEEEGNEQWQPRSATGTAVLEKGKHSLEILNSVC